MVVKIQVAVFWIVKPCSVVVGYHNTLHHEYGGSMILQNVAILPQARRLQLENML